LPTQEQTFVLEPLKADRLAQRTVFLTQIEVEAQPNLFTPFTNVSNDDLPVYTAAGEEGALPSLLTAKMAEYNETNVAMNLVLFQQAIPPPPPPCPLPFSPPSPLFSLHPNNTTSGSMSLSRKQHH